MFHFVFTIMIGCEHGVSLHDQIVIGAQILSEQDGTIRIDDDRNDWIYGDEVFIENGKWSSSKAGEKVGFPFFCRSVDKFDARNKGKTVDETLDAILGSCGSKDSHSTQTQNRDAGC